MSWISFIRYASSCGERRKGADMSSSVSLVFLVLWHVWRIDQDLIAHIVSLYFLMLTIAVSIDSGHSGQVECATMEEDDGFDECKSSVLHLWFDFAPSPTRRAAHPILIPFPRSPRACRSCAAHRSGRQDHKQAHDPRQRASQAPHRSTPRRRTSNGDIRLLQFGDAARP